MSNGWDEGDGRVQAGEVLNGVLGEGSDVDYHVSIDGVSADLTVTGIGLYEPMSQLCRGTLSAQTHEGLTERELIAKDIHVRIERGAEHRSFRGIIRSASIRYSNEGNFVALEI